MSESRQYLVVYEDWAGDTEITIMVTDMAPEVGLKALGITGRIINLEVIDGDHSRGSTGPGDRDAGGVAGPTV